MKKRTKGEPSLGDAIIAGLEEALSYERGELRGVKVTRATLVLGGAEVSPAPAYRATRIAMVRERLQLSQPVFAAALNVSPETVKKWEQGTREPDGAALRLLELAETHPEWIAERVTAERPIRRTRRPRHK
jgi:putative transcriptional regulator